MKQRQFEAQNEAEWAAFAALLERENTRSGASARDATDFVARYRRVCRDLALARARGYGPGVVARLNDLALRGHQRVYTRRSGFGRQLRAFALRDFPRAVREAWRYVLVAALLFVLPGAAIATAIAIEPSAVYLVFSPQEVRSYEAMYAPGQPILGAARQAEDDFAMFGMYIANNIGIGFQCFATGVLFGLGPVFYLVFNSLAIGAVTAHLTSVGSGGNFYPFVIGHGAFELTAIVLSGTAGLLLGHALVAPGRSSRADALVHAGRRAAPIVFGMFSMLLIAAFLEAFWSARSLVPVWARLLVGALLWAFVILYFVRAGRGRRSAGVPPA